MWYGTGAAPSVWTKRRSITLDCPSGGPSFDHDVTIPQGWDEFWTTIDSSGNELRVVNSVGTLLDYGVDNGSGEAFSKTNRLGRIRINHTTAPAIPGMQCAWLYYGSTSTQGSSGGAAGTGGQSGYIELASPSGPHRFAHRPQVPGTLQPRESFHKTAAETCDVWIYLGRATARGITPIFGSVEDEELHYITQSVENTAGADQAAMYNLSMARFVWVEGQGMWVRCIVQAGSTGSNYTLSLVSRLAGPLGGANRVIALDTRIGIKVKDNRLAA